MKRCFTISPIGQQGSETRGHADIRSFLFECMASSPLYAVAAKEFQAIWQANNPDEC